MRRLSLAALLPALALAQPSTMAYQGYLTDDAGVPLDADVDLHFRLMDAPSGGNEISVQTIAGVNVTDGLFTVALAIVDSDAAAAELYLEVAVDDPTNVLLPRQRLASVPFALDCGDVDMLGGDATSVQTRVAATCPAGSSIRVVNVDGTVLCDADAGHGGGLDSVNAGLGLLGAGPMSGNVVVDVAVGAGLFVDVGNDVVADFGGNGVAQSASRADHTHTGYLPRGNSVFCGTFKATAINPTTGDVSCGPDADNTVGASTSGRITYDGSSQTFDLNPFLFLPGSVTAADYGFSPVVTRYGYKVLHASDFRPRDPTYPSYYVDWYSGRGSLSPPPQVTYVHAPLHLPHGAFVTNVRVTYSKVSSSNDVLNCSIDALEVATGLVSQPGGVTPDCPFGCPFSQMEIFPNFSVDNTNFTYVASCWISAPDPFSDVSLYAYRVQYQYFDLEGP